MLLLWIRLLRSAAWRQAQQQPHLEATASCPVCADVEPSMRARGSGRRASWGRSFGGQAHAARRCAARASSKAALRSTSSIQFGPLLPPLAAAVAPCRPLRSLSQSSTTLRGSGCLHRTREGIFKPAPPGCSALQPPLQEIRRGRRWWRRRCTQPAHQLPADLEHDGRQR